MSIWARLYQHVDYGGRSTYASLPYEASPDTYLQVPRSWLDSVDLHDRISSLNLGASSWESGGYAILFQDSGYKGRYALFQSIPGQVVQIPNLAAEEFNDRTSSILLVRRFAVELPPLALGNLGSPSLRDQLAEMVENAPRLSLRGDPIITWDLWPSFSPSRKYVYLRAPVRVDIPNWFDYDAEVRFWIYFYINSSGKLRGYLDWYGAWVEGGAKTDDILDRLSDGLAESVGEINSRITEAVETFEACTFVRLYYLPGRAQHTGHVNDDVSMVLVKGL